MKLQKGPYSAKTYLGGNPRPLAIGLQEEVVVDYGAVFEKQSPSAGSRFSANVFYQSALPNATWSFTYRESLEFSYTGDGASVGSIYSFSPTELAGYESRVDIYRRTGGVDVFVETLGSNQYELANDDIGASLFAKQRLVSGTTEATDPQEFVFVTEVFTSTPDVTFTGTLDSYLGGGIGRWNLSGSWDDASFATAQYIYSARNGGSPPSSYVTPCFDPGNNVDASAWHESHPDARARITIGGTGTNKNFVATIPIVVGTSDLGFAGFGGTSVPGATDAEIGNTGSWNWRSGDSITFEVFLS